MSSPILSNSSINSSIEEREYTYRLKFRDNAGNIIIIDTSFIYDTTKPTLVSLKDGNNYSIPQNGFTNNDTVKVSAWDLLSGLKEIKLTGPSSFETSYTYTGETTYVTASFNGLPEGNITAAVYDQAGNGGISNFTKDTIPPVIQITVPEDHRYYNTSITPSISINDLNLDTIKTVIKLNNSTYITAVSIPKTGITMGYNLRVHAEDFAGNRSDTTINFIIGDSNKPATVLDVKEFIKVE